MGTSRKLSNQPHADGVSAKQASDRQARDRQGRDRQGRDRQGGEGQTRKELARSVVAKGSQRAAKSRVADISSRSSSPKVKVNLETKPKTVTSRRKVAGRATRAALKVSNLKRSNPAKRANLKVVITKRSVGPVNSVTNNKVTDNKVTNNKVTNNKAKKIAINDQILNKDTAKKNMAAKVALIKVKAATTQPLINGELALKRDVDGDRVIEGRPLHAASEGSSSLNKGSSISVLASHSHSAFVVNPQIFRPRPVIQPPSGKPELFKAGDKVVYPGHGVGILDEVVTKSVGGSDHTFYGITILDSKQTKIMVPVSQAHMVGLRKIVSMQQMQEVFEMLRRRSGKGDARGGHVRSQTWNRRSRDYTLKLKTGSLMEIAEVTCELAVLAKTKELSFGERKMLESAQYLLISELALVKDRSHEAILGELHELMS